MSISLLTPQFVVDSILNINLQELRARGIKGLLLDYDNTLLRWTENKVHSRVCAWIRKAKRLGFSLCIVSNADEKRLHTQSALLGIPYVQRALKPTCAGIERALNLLGLSKNEAVMVGDQLFTDVLAGNRAGLNTVLVRPIYLQEQWWMKAVRWLEDRIQAVSGTCSTFTAVPGTNY